MTIALASALSAAPADLAAAKRQFESSGRDETARQAYVGKLASLLGHEVEVHMRGGQGNEALIAQVDAELRKHPAPKDADSAALTKLRVGKWQSPRHDYIYRANGTWEMGPGDGTNGHWSIKGNQYLADGTAYTIVLLDRDYFVFMDKGSVFFEQRLRK